MSSSLMSVSAPSFPSISWYNEYSMTARWASETNGSALLAYDARLLRTNSTVATTVDDVDDKDQCLTLDFNPDDDTKEPVGRLLSESSSKM